MTTLTHSASAPARSPANATQRILAALRAADADLVARHPWLGRDDLVATAFFLGAVATIGGFAVAWLAGALGGAWTVCGITLGLSVLHEMEHDLIHDLYLAHPAARVPVLLTIWFAKASVDPWTRGRWHRWHHAVSGQGEDVEERLIGLGLPWGLLRVFVTLLPPTSLLLKPGIQRAIRRRVEEGGKRPELRGPRGWWMMEVVTGLMAVLPFVALGGWIAGAAWSWPLLILWVLPNTLRHASIVFMSSNSHYTHIHRGMVLEQNQILDHPIFWPLQFFCWNFGATHVIHHFFVRQPFWRRTLVFGEVRQALIDGGVPANDLQTFRRANRRLAS